MLKAELAPKPAEKAASDSTRESVPDRENGVPVRFGLATASACPCGGQCPRCRSALAETGTQTPGDRLPPRLQCDLGRQLGMNLSDVRVHHGERANLAALGLGARAYTLGQDIVFSPGRYAPDSPEGVRLLKHELAHVAQQSSRATVAGNAALEQEADTFAIHGKAPRSAAPSAPQLEPLSDAEIAELQMRGDLRRLLQRAQENDREAGVIVNSEARNAQLQHESIRLQQAIRELRLAPSQHSSSTATAPTVQTYSFTLRYPGRADIQVSNATAAEATRAMRGFLNQLLATVAGGAAGLAHLTTLHEDQWVVAGVADTLGGVSLPPMTIWRECRTSIARVETFLSGQMIADAARECGNAATRVRAAERQVYEYREGTISGAERAEFGLQVVVVSSAAIVAIGTGGIAAGAGGATWSTGLAIGATAGGSAGLTGLAGGAVYGGVQQVAGQGMEVRLGLRDRIDWSGIAFDTVIGAVLGMIGGRLGQTLVSRMAAHPALARFSAPILRGLLTDLVSGSLTTAMHTAAREVFDQFRGESNRTLSQFIDMLFARLLDPRQVFLNLILGAAQRRLANRGVSQGQIADAMQVAEQRTQQRHAQEDAARGTPAPLRTRIERTLQQAPEQRQLVDGLVRAERAAQRIPNRPPTTATIEGASFQHTPRQVQAALNATSLPPAAARLPQLFSRAMAALNNRRLLREVAREIVIEEFRQRGTPISQPTGRPAITSGQRAIETVVEREVGPLSQVHESAAGGGSVIIRRPDGSETPPTQFTDSGVQFEGRPFLDIPLAGTDHGSHTHAFQMLVLRRSFARSGINVNEFFQMLGALGNTRMTGSPETFTATGFTVPGTLRQAAWDTLMDRFVTNGPHLNSPEAVNLFLREVFGTPGQNY